VKFNYRFISRHGAVFYATGWILAGVVGLIWAFVFGSQNTPANNKLIGAAIFCSVILLWVLISLWGWRQTRIFMQPVVITDRGIASGLRPERPRFWAKANPGFIEFDSITEVAMLANPDLDADSRRWGVSAIRIRAPDKKIVVWKVIQDFDRLCALIESEMSRHGKPLRISPKDVIIPAGTGMAVVLFP
jgi:hypothetical protein